MKEAAYAAVLGWKNALNVDPRVKQQADKVEDIDKDYDKMPEPKPIPPREQKMLAAFDIYINYIKDPKDDELVGMKFLKANIYRRYNHFDKAIPLFEDILDKHREHETAEYSANLLLDTYNRHAAATTTMLALADKLDERHEVPRGQGRPQRRRSRSSRRSRCARRPRSSRRRPRTRKDFGKYVACGQAYLDIYNRNPEATENDEVLYNAGVCFEEGKSIGAAIQTFNTAAEVLPELAS